VEANRGEIDVRELKLPKKLALHGLWLALWRIQAILNTKKAKRWMHGEAAETTERLKQKIRKQMVKVYGEAKIAELWPDLQEKFANPAVARATWLAGKVGSRRYMDAIIEAPYVGTLGAALQLDPYLELIPKNDIIRFIRDVDPMFMSVCLRYHMAADLVSRKDSVTDLACGTLLPFRLLSTDTLPKRIVACDKTDDVRVLKCCADYAKVLTGQDVELDFRNADLFEVLDGLPDQSQDAILANGILTYLSDEERKHLMSLAIMKLKSGGVLMTDLQLQGWSIDFCVHCLEWSYEMRLNESVRAAKSTIEHLVSDLPVESVMYHTHPYLKGEKDLLEVNFKIKAL